MFKQIKRNNFAFQLRHPQKKRGGFFELCKVTRTSLSSHRHFCHLVITSTGEDADDTPWLAKENHIKGEESTL